LMFCLFVCCLCFFSQMMSFPLERDSVFLWKKLHLAPTPRKISDLGRARELDMETVASFSFPDWHPCSRSWDLSGRGQQPNIFTACFSWHGNPTLWAGGKTIRVPEFSANTMQGRTYILWESRKK
jgi:hypothetical protein